MLVNQEKKYEDAHFLTNASAIYFENEGENDLASFENEIVWQRAHDNSFL